MSDNGLDLSRLLFLQHAVGGVGLEGALEGVGQELGHAVVQLHGWAREGHLILVVGAFGVQVAEEGTHLLGEEEEERL